MALPVQSSRAMLPALLLLLSTTQPTPAEELAGRFGLIMRVPVRSHFPVLGEVQATYESFHLVTLEPDGRDKIVQRERTCTVGIHEDLRFFDIHISPRAVSTVPEARAHGQLTLHDGRWHYAVTMPRRSLGMTPEASRLPTSAVDEDVRDTDGDGKPGLTLALTTPVGLVEVFVVQRDQAALHGEVKGGALVEGRVEVLSLEQRVIGTQPSLTERMDLRTEATQGATFSLFRLPPDAGCEALGEGRWAAHLDKARRLAAVEKPRGASLVEEARAAP